MPVVLASDAVGNVAGEATREALVLDLIGQLSVRGAGVLLFG